MISHDYRCVFVHQRKCASTSIIAAFGVEPRTKAWGVGANGLFKPEYAPIADLIEAYFKFAVVRNPWDRFVSGWKYCKSTRKRSLLDVLTNPPTDRHDYRHLMVTQHKTLIRADGSSAVDFLMRYERLQEDFDEVCRRIGKPRVELPRLNTTHRPSYQDVFDDESRAIFDLLFAEDIRRYGYDYDDPAGDGLAPCLIASRASPSWAGETA